MNRFLNALSLVLGFLLLALIIAYAAIIIPIAMASVAGLCLALWLYGNTVDGLDMLARKWKRWRSDRD